MSRSPGFRYYIRKLFISQAVTYGVLVLPAFADERGVERRVQRGVTRGLPRRLTRTAPGSRRTATDQGYDNGGPLSDQVSEIFTQNRTVYTTRGRNGDRPVPWARPTTMLQTRIMLHPNDGASLSSRRACRQRVRRRRPPRLRAHGRLREPAQDVPLR